MLEFDSCYIVVSRKGDGKGSTLGRGLFVFAWSLIKKGVVLISNKGENNFHAHMVFHLSYDSDLGNRQPAEVDNSTFEDAQFIELSLEPGPLLYLFFGCNKLTFLKYCQ